MPGGTEHRRCRLCIGCHVPHSRISGKIHDDRKTWRGSRTDIYGYTLGKGRARERNDKWDNCATSMWIMCVLIYIYVYIFQRHSKSVKEGKIYFLFLALTCSSFLSLAFFCHLPQFFVSLFLIRPRALCSHTSVVYIVYDNSTSRCIIARYQHQSPTALSLPILRVSLNTYMYIESKVYSGRGAETPGNHVL